MLSIFHNFNIAHSFFTLKMLNNFGCVILLSTIYFTFRDKFTTKKGYRIVFFLHGQIIKKIGGGGVKNFLFLQCIIKLHPSCYFRRVV